MVVWLSSFPRSGNTYFRIALEKLYGRPSLSLYEDDPASISRKISPCVEQGLKSLEASKEIHFIKTHELPTDNNPAILLVRDGRDAMVSFAHFIDDYEVVHRSRAGEFFARLDVCRQQLLHARPRFDQLLQRVITGKYFDWSAHFHAWRTGSRGCAVVHFESLVSRPADTVHQSLAALGIELASHENAVPSFAQLHAQDPKFFRAGTSGQWRKEMSPQLEELFWRQHRQAMLAAGYSK